MLRIVQLEEIENKLLEVSNLIDSFDGYGYSFTEKVEDWLNAIDRIFQQNRLAASGQISSLRGLLLSVRNGAVLEGVSISGKPTRRKRLAVSALHIVHQAVDIIESAIRDDRVRFEEAKRVALLLISIGRTAGLIPSEAPMGNGQRYARQLINAIKANGSTTQHIIHLEGLTGQVDAIVIIDRCLHYATPEPSMT